MLVAVLLALVQHQCVDASFWDGIPVISQIKSAVQAIGGDTEGAKRTQENFLNQAPVISQVKSAVQAGQGDHAGAKRTQEQFLHETIEPVAENTPGVGHLVGVGHIAAGNKERGEAIIKGATTNTAAVAGAFLGGPAGAIGAGAAMDGIFTGADTAAHGEFKPFGVVDHFDRMGKGQLSIGDHFDFVTGTGLEFAGGTVAKNNGHSGPAKFSPGVRQTPHVDSDGRRVSGESNPAFRPSPELHPSVNREFKPHGSVNAFDGGTMRDMGESRPVARPLKQFGPVIHRDFAVPHRASYDFDSPRTRPMDAGASGYGSAARPFSSFGDFGQNPVAKIMAEHFETMRKNQFGAGQLDDVAKPLRDADSALSKVKPDEGQRVGSSNQAGNMDAALVDLSGIDSQVIKLDPTDGSHNIQTGEKWKSPQEMSMKEFGQVVSDMEGGKLSKDFYHVDHWPEPYKSKLQAEINKLSPEHKKHISGRDLKMIVNDVYLDKNCYYCSLARAVGVPVKEMETRTKIKMKEGEFLPQIVDIADRLGLKPKKVIEGASVPEFHAKLDELIGKNEHKKFLISYDWSNHPGAHMTNFEAWRSADGQLHQLHKDFQQPTTHHLDRTTSPNSRFSAKMPENIKNLYLIEVTPELAEHTNQRRRRRRSTSSYLDTARARTGLPAEEASQLTERDFDDILDVGASQDPTGQLSATARVKGVTVSELVNTLDEDIAQRPLSVQPIIESYKRLGFDNAQVSRPMREPEFLKYLDTQTKSGKDSNFTLVYWPRGAAGLEVRAMKTWKNDDDQLKMMIIDHTKEFGMDRISETLPIDALWFYTAALPDAGEIGAIDAALQVLTDKLDETKSQTGATECGGDAWADRQCRYLKCVSSMMDRAIDTTHDFAKRATGLQQCSNVLFQSFTMEMKGPFQ